MSGCKLLDRGGIPLSSAQIQDVGALARAGDFDRPGRRAKVRWNVATPAVPTWTRSRCASRFRGRSTSSSIRATA